MSSRTRKQKDVCNEKSEDPRADADAFSLTDEIPALRGGVLTASARYDLEHEVDVYWMRTSSLPTKFTRPCWCWRRMSYFFFFFSESWFFLLVQSGATSRASVEDELLRELFDVTRRSIRMCLYTIVTMWMTTNAWYIRKWALSQVICQIVEINWYWKTRWVRSPRTWRFV